MADEPEQPTETFVETGRIEVVVGMNEEGEARRGFSVSGMNSYEAIAHLDVIAEAMRQSEVDGWRSAARGSGDN